MIPGKLYTRNNLYAKDPNFFRIKERFRDIIVFETVLDWLGAGVILYTGKTYVGTYHINSPNRFSFFEFIHKSKIVYFHDTWALKELVILNYGK